MGNTRITADNRERILADIERKMDLILSKGAHDIEAGAKIAAPVDTGFLRAGIGARCAGPLHWQVIVIAAYGYWVEFGTTRRKATPFLLPAYNRVIGTVKTALHRMAARAGG